MIIQENVSLAPYTTFRIGGPARYFIFAQSIDDAREALEFAHSRSLKVFILGGGSNVLISDNGINGLVLAVRIPGITRKYQDGHVFVTVGSGVIWDELVVWTIEHGLVGLECLSGVPGTVGGAVVANLGCYGAQASDVIVAVDVLDLTEPVGALTTLTKDDCRFSYHDSIFARQPGHYLIVRVTFLLEADGTPQPNYRDNRFDLAALAAKHGRTPTPMDVRNAVLDVREQKGNLIMEGRLSYKGAGSFFHMPFVSAKQYAHLVATARSLDPVKEERLRPWAWEQHDGSYKVAPGFLFEYTEFQKGYQRGAVGISPKHTLAIINTANACAQDVAQLAQDMQRAVEKIFGICLEREVEYIGDIEKQ